MARWQFKLPDIGEGVTEGEIVCWLVKAGDVVREDQPMVEVMTPTIAEQQTTRARERADEMRTTDSRQPGMTTPLLQGGRS